MLRIVEHIVEAGIIAHAHEAVYLRHFLKERIAIALCQAAGHEQLLQPAGLFVFRHFEYRIDGLFLCGLNEAAGVHEYDVRLRRIRHDLVAALAQHAQQIFGVHAVFRAAQRYHAHCFHKGSFLRIEHVHHLFAADKHRARLGAVGL